MNIHPLSPNAAEIMRTAQQESQNSGSPYVGSEHILIAFSLNPNTFVVQGFTLPNKKAINNEIMSILHYAKRFPPSHEEPTAETETLTGCGSLTFVFTDIVKNILTTASQLASKSASPEIRAEDLFVGLIQDQQSMAAKILGNLGFNLAELINQVQAQHAD